MNRPVVRRRGPSLRLRLTLSYAVFLVIAGAAMFAVLIAVLRFVPEGNLISASQNNWVPNRSDLLDVAVPLVAWGMGFLAVIGLAGGWFLAGRMLRPIGPIDHAVRRAAAGSLDHRIDLPGPDDELRRLADGFDDMLGKLQQSFEEQRQFTANASHELRTPLAINKTMLEVARSTTAGASSATDVQTSALLGRLDEVNDRAIAILESLLQLARSDRVPVTRQACSLDDMVRESVSRLSPDERLRVVPDLLPTGVDADPVLVNQLVRNLIDNAMIHGARDSPVWIRTFVETDGRSTLTIENAGAVLDAALVSKLSEPFVRATGRTRGVGGGGSGLGLSVVASVARAHGAELTLQPRHGGGLVATVAFPVHP